MSTRFTTCITHAQRKANPSRGIAMLLVLICLAVATVTATAYIASRDNSMMIGENVSSSAASRWAASSGLDLAVATLETNWDWRNEHSNGVLFSDLRLAGADVTVTATDLLTEQNPDHETMYIRVESTADIDGVTQTASAVLFVGHHDAGDSVSVDLSEFAVFAAEGLALRGSAFVTRWPNSPLSQLGTRVLVGTQAMHASGIAVRDSSAAIDVTAYAPPDASKYLVESDSGPEVPMFELPDPISFPRGPVIEGVDETVSPAPPPMMFANGRFTFANDTRSRSLEVKGNGTLVLGDGVTLVIEQDLKLLETGTIEVLGEARIIVFGDMRMDSGAAIELMNPNAALTMFVKGRSGTALEIRDSYIGQGPREFAPGALGNAQWVNPNKITIYSMAGSANEWRIRGGSTVKGTLYAPDIEAVSVEDSSGVYGRVAARNLQLRDDAGLFYCPSMNAYNGYTNLSSALYDENGRLKDEFRTIDSLDRLLLEPIASTTRTVIRIGRQLLGGGGTEPDDDVGPNDATPRTNTVHYNPLAFGSDVSTWEGGM